MDSLTAALAYHDEGFSVFPLTPKSKRPLIKWGRYQKEKADKATIASWWSDYPDAGVAIIAGQISGGLAVLDVDHFEFSKWLEARADALNTWVVKTGSGKIHIYLRSKEKCVTTELKSEEEFLADIRGDGQGLSGPSYLAAPPTIHPTTERPYQTLFGSPPAIRGVENAHFIFTEIGKKFAGSAHLTARGNTEAAPVTLPPMVGISRESITEKLASERGITGKIRRAIDRDATAGTGEWTRVHTHSEIDYAVTSALLECDWGPEEVQAVFHYFPIGANHYRDASRPGQDYLVRTLGAAMEKVERSREAARIAEGENFKVQRVVKVAWDEPKYDVHFTDESGQERKVTIDHDDLFSELGFRKKLARGMSVLPKMKVEHTGRKKFEAFSDLLLQMASVEEIPEDATTAGHFRTEVRNEIRRAIKSSRNIGTPPEAKEEFDILWGDDDYVYVRGNRLVNEMSKVMRADPPVVWDAIKHFGGEWRSVTYGEKIEEGLWAIPRKTIEE